MLGEERHRGVQPGFDRPDGNLERLSDLGVRQPLKIRQKQDFSMMLRQRVNDLLDEPIPLVFEHGVARRRDIHFHEIHKGPPAISIERRRKADRRLPSISTMVVPTFVRCNRKKPWFESAGSVKRVRGKMDLKKRLLKDIFCCLSIAHKTDKESEEVLFVPSHERPKRLRIALAVLSEKLLVGSIINEPQV
jgi:hypothetical protein